MKQDHDYDDKDEDLDTGYNHEEVEDFVELLGSMQLNMVSLDTKHREILRFEVMMNG